ncbi:hypothetical protein HDU67_006752 [Dinochytrium kinnereticum]|nr:hypothetical protein HDU67_006752 [Dinochytrium kinnereticum]
MPNNAKKKISKIKGVEKAHPHSRKAEQLRRAIAREDRIGKLKGAKNQIQRAAVDRMVFFKFALPDDVKMATMDMMHDLIQQYVCRNDDEIKEMTESLRSIKQKPATLQQMEWQREKDVVEYNCGFSIPNMTDASNVKRLRNWNGDYNGLGEIKLMTMRSREAVQKEKEAKEFVEAKELIRIEKTLLESIVGMDTDD